MKTMTRREILIRAGIGIGAANFGLLGCSRTQNAIAEPPLLQESGGRWDTMIQYVTEADNTFGRNLLQQIWKQQPDANIFVSPISLALALHMTVNGAKGETLKAMRKTLALDAMSLDNLNPSNAALLGALANPDPKVQLEIANSLWSNGLLPDFEKRIETYYAAETGSLSGVPDTVNDWVKAKTKGKIEDILKSLPPNVVAILVNAAYFKGLWSSPFNKAGTTNDTFLTTGKQSLSVPMMTQTGNFPYLRGKGFQAIRLPYGSGRMNFLVLLPDEDKPLEEMFAHVLSLTDEKKMAVQRGTISLPRFQLRYEAELKSVLSALGMGIAFDPTKADFSAMFPDSWIGKVIHKTYLEVNEEGTEAAASSAVVMQTKGAAISGFNMRVNRPFCCAIQDTRTGALLFLGAIVNPLT